VVGGHGGARFAQAALGIPATGLTLTRRERQATLPSMALPDDPSDHTPGNDHDEDRAAILARRRFLIRRSLGALGAAVLGSVSADCSAPPQPCLGAVYDGSSMVDTPEATDATANDAVVDAPEPEDAAPMPCLRVVPDAGPEVGDAGSDAPEPEDAAPMPCLRVVPDSGRDQ
jgi:hypothetical protein